MYAEFVKWVENKSKSECGQSHKPVAVKVKERLSGLSQEAVIV